jgi:hypothetical protein
VRGAAALGLVLGCATLACGRAAPPLTPDPERPASPEKEAKVEEPAQPPFPAPFTWEEIRAATPAGRTYRYQVEVPGKPPRERLVTFVSVDADGGELFAGGEDPKRFAWASLQNDAEFPQDRVTTREETVKIPAGKFDCMVYEVRVGDGEVTTYYFARRLPGAPVLYFTERAGKRVKTTTLLQHIPGKG